MRVYNCGEPIWDRLSMTKIACVALPFALVAGFSLARGQAAAPDAGAQVVPTDSFAVKAFAWPRVVVNFLVESKKGLTAPVPVSSLEISEDGTPQKIELIAGPGTPVSLCLVIDLSGSMKTKRDVAVLAAKELIEHLPPGSEAAVMVFAEISYLAAPFTPAAIFDLGLFDHLEAIHRTALRDAVVFSEQYFAQSARFPRRALVLITDGGDNVSHHRVGDAARSMQMPASPFSYLLVIVDPFAPTPEERTGTVYLPFLVAKSTVLENVTKGAAEISRCIDGQYALTYRSALTVHDKHLHKIKVRLAEPDPLVKIDSPPGYYIPSQ